ncbi:phosphoribosylanthranilate isomerase [Zhongshania aquimaris]|uniref:N-(5'-phosphoribosyl)anthranilate isomerase n=1 Tax=Zhongshania aquimaris TaxID=2857107 RepID=A0ABS6VM13_9GAMM|nr:phosphoribosylanthranilate isomerase [Zhongshania aquimaris]
MFRTRVKICGITQAEDALAAIDAGADALGFVFYPRSPRAVSVELAASIMSLLPPFVSKVGLFVDASEAEIQNVLTSCSLDLIQFHGDETPDFCNLFSVPYMKALRMRDGLDVAAAAQAYSSASALLLDSYKPGIPGGTGESFDWDRVPRELALPIVLAGGLTPSNAGAAIAACHPFAMDVSGGVEKAPGKKCTQKMTEFIKAVSRADRRED